MKTKEAKANSLPGWLSNTFAKLSSGHPLRSLIEVQDVDSPVGDRAEVSGAADASYRHDTPILQEESVFAFQPPDVRPQSSIPDLPQNNIITDEHPILLPEPQPFSTPGPGYQADAYSLDFKFSDSLIRHSTPNVRPPYFAARAIPSRLRTPLPFSTPGPAASFTVSPPPSRTRKLRFDVPDSDTTDAFEYVPAPAYPPFLQGSISNPAAHTAYNLVTTIPEFDPYNAHEQERALEYEEMAPSFSEYDPISPIETRITPSTIQSQAISMQPTTTNVFSTTATTSTDPDDFDDWLSAEALGTDPAWPEPHEPLYDLPGGLDDKEFNANGNKSMSGFTPDEIRIPQTPALPAPTPRKKKPRLAFNPAPGIYISPGSSTSSISLPAHVDHGGSDPFISQANESEVPEEKDSESAQLRPERGDPPTAKRRPKFRPAIIADEHAVRKQVPQETDVRNSALLSLQ